MKALIIHAHPEEKSFSSALKNTAVEYFSSNGNEVKVSDLYKMGFNPVGGKEDFKGRRVIPNSLSINSNRQTHSQKICLLMISNAEMEKFHLG